MKISDFLANVNRNFRGADLPDEAETSKRNPDVMLEKDAVEERTQHSKAIDVIAGLHPEPPAPIDQKKIEAVAERDRVLKSLAEARVLLREAREEQEKEYPGEPMRYFLEKLAPTLADAGPSWDESVRIPLGRKGKE